jgi:hypothetical protein
MDEDKQVAICKQCHDIPYKIEWEIKPPAHTVYKKNLVSDEGYPTVKLTKKNGTILLRADSFVVFSFEPASRFKTRKLR